LSIVEVSFSLDIKMPNSLINIMKYENNNERCDLKFNCIANNFINRYSMASLFY